MYPCWFIHGPPDRVEPDKSQDPRHEMTESRRSTGAVSPSGARTIKHTQNSHGFVPTMRLSLARNRIAQRPWEIGPAVYGHGKVDNLV